MSSRLLSACQYRSKTFKARFGPKAGEAANAAGRPLTAKLFLATTTTRNDRLGRDRNAPLECLEAHFSKARVPT
jgi:hypothetical protein